MAGEEVRAAIRNWIIDLHARLDQASYYQLLGVATDASEDQVKSAYYKLAARLHPDLYGDMLDEETRQKLVTLYSRVAEAHKILSDGAKRHQYDVQLKSGKLRFTKEDERPPVRDPEAQIASASAKKFFKLGRAAVIAGDQKSAILNLKMALSVEPASQIIKAELARAEALAPKKS
jgi:curved DNA-binding protein CbpA